MEKDGPKHKIRQKSHKRGTRVGVRGGLEVESRSLILKSPREKDTERHYHGTRIRIVVDSISGLAISEKNPGCFGGGNAPSPPNM
ncbi:hypothetical protein L1987_24944 [Smallanthus sonchifolius]|uniref:Uncharacterized protein n=1 Tax=Smallanthus sonchifolius TaxID=185202 RepID=A0ACB9INC1_9ASTR|nr:hypothetical protein L1987_24944 [Smallanthus sonchifolius]